MRGRAGRIAKLLMTRRQRRNRRPALKRSSFHQRLKRKIKKMAITHSVDGHFHFSGELRLATQLRLYDLLGRVAARADAVWHADAAVGVARERESGHLPAQVVDSIEAIQMSHTILRHGGLPFVDAGEKRLGAQTG